jgi:hypothetical protein
MQIKKRYHYTPIIMVTIKTLTTPVAGKDVVQKKLSVISSGNAKWKSHCGKQSGRVLEN